jgi:creatine kinase/arginine kinase
MRTVAGRAVLSGLFFFFLFWPIAGAQGLCDDVMRRLPPQSAAALGTIQTDNGVTLRHIMRSGRRNVDSEVGCYAGDADSYRCFAPLFDPIIAKLHGTSSHYRHTEDFGVGSIPALSPAYDAVVQSNRIRIARNLRAYPFPSHMTTVQRRQVENDVASAITTAFRDTEFAKGRYYRLEELDQETYVSLVARHLLFAKGGDDMAAAGILDDWPHGRSAYVTEDGKLAIWINEEDHMRLTYLDVGGDIKASAEKAFLALRLLGQYLNYAIDSRLGALTSCPSNVGTGMRASLHLALSTSDQAALLARYRDDGLAIRGTGGEGTEISNNTFDVSLKARYGATEQVLLTTFVNAVNAAWRDERAD